MARGPSVFHDGPGAWTRARRLLPAPIRDAAVHWVLFSDRRSRRAFRGSYRGSDAKPVPLALRRLHGNPFWIRPGTADPWTLRETFTYADQLPPEPLEPQLIVDAGANIGASMALLAVTFPSARILGLEPDPENAALCRRNIEPWKERCEVLEMALWSLDGSISLSGSSEATLAVNTDGHGQTVPTVSVSTLMDRYAGGRDLDYVKLDVEGAERELLTANTAWASRVRCISVEVHSPYQVDECLRDLAALGFQPSTEPAPRQPRVVGRRD